MTDPTILGAAVFFIGVMALVAGCYLVTAFLRERAYQRALEAKYADEWQRAHRRHRHDDRHTHEREGAPE